MNFFKRTRYFFECILQDSCKYSIKKLITITFCALIIYLVIFTTKDYYQLLMFVAALLGIRSWERLKNSNLTNTDQPDPESGTPEKPVEPSQKPEEK